MLPSSRFLVWIFLCQKVRQWLPPCVLQGGCHCLPFLQRNIQPKNLGDGIDNIIFCLKVWLFGGWAETSLNQFEQKLSKLPRTENKIAHPPKQVHRSAMWHMKDTRQGYLFCKRVFIDLSSCSIARGRQSWAKITVFQIHVTYFLFWQNLIFWRILLTQHYICMIFLDFDLCFAYFIIQNYPVTREWNEADWLDPLIYSILDRKLECLIGHQINSNQDSHLDIYLEIHLEGNIESHIEDDIDIHLHRHI